LNLDDEITDVIKLNLSDRNGAGYHGVSLSNTIEAFDVAKVVVMDASLINVAGIHGTSLTIITFGVVSGVDTSLVGIAFSSGASYRSFTVLIHLDRDTATIDVAVVVSARYCARAGVGLIDGVSTSVLSTSRRIANIKGTSVAIFAQAIVVALDLATINTSAFPFSTSKVIRIIAVGILIGAAVAVIVNTVTRIVSTRRSRHVVSAALLQFSSNTFHVSINLASAHTTGGRFTFVIIVVSTLADREVTRVIATEAVANVVGILSTSNTVSSGFTFATSTGIDTATRVDIANPALAIGFLELSIAQRGISSVRASSGGTSGDSALRTIGTSIVIIFRHNATRGGSTNIDSTFNIIVAFLRNVLATIFTIANVKSTFPVVVAVHKFVR